VYFEMEAIRMPILGKEGESSGFNFAYPPEERDEDIHVYTSKIKNSTEKWRMQIISQKM